MTETYNFSRQTQASYGDALKKFGSFYSRSGKLTAKLVLNAFEKNFDTYYSQLNTVISRQWILHALKIFFIMLEHHGVMSEIPKIAQQQPLSGIISRYVQCPERDQFFGQIKKDPKYLVNQVGAKNVKNFMITELLLATASPDFV